MYESLAYSPGYLLLKERLGMIEKPKPGWRPIFKSWLYHLVRKRFWKIKLEYKIFIPLFKNKADIVFFKTFL